MEFSVKSINFLGRQSVVICQNQNGPCPLLAIANILLLQNKISISSDISIISLAELTQIVANAILEKIGQSSLPDHVKLVESVLNILPKLARGLDLNVIFSGVNKFEFTEEISVFDALGIQLLHGWICDPNNIETCALIGNLSYNHLMFRLVEYKSLSLERKEAEEDNRAGLNIGGEIEAPAVNCDSTKDIQVLRQEGALMEKFLADTAGQFTYPGMLALYSVMQDRQFAVFFRNNHFSTMFFYNGQLFTLITDLGYLHEPSVVWELLDHIDGNSEFYNDRFEPLSSVQSPGFIERHLQEFTALASVTTLSGSSPSAVGGTIAAPPVSRHSNGVPTICAPPAVRTVEKKTTTVTENVDLVEGDVPDLPLAPAAGQSEAFVDTGDVTNEASLLESGVLVSSTDASNPIDETAICAPKPTTEALDDSYELVDHHHASEASESHQATPAPQVETVVHNDEVISEALPPGTEHMANNWIAETPVESSHTMSVATPVDNTEVSAPTRKVEASLNDSTPAIHAENPVHVAAPQSTIDADMLFAMQLQAEEDRLAAQHHAHNLARQTNLNTHTSYTTSSNSHSNSAQGSLLSQEESDREHALMLHYQQMQEDEQLRGAQITSSSGSVPPTRYTTYAASGSGSFPYNRQQERPTQHRGKDKNCVIS